MDKLKEFLKSSMMMRIFAFSFLIVHIPLIALLAYSIVVEELQVVPVVVVAVLATLVASGLAFIMVWRLVRPIDDLSDAVEQYRISGVFPNPDVWGPARVRRLAQGINEMVQAKEGTIRVLRTQANVDALTGIGNRRWLKKASDALIQRALGNGHKIWVVMFDIDHFKSINDRFGHAVGDEVLRGVADIAQHHIRPNDVIARIGGEEFCFLFAHEYAQPAMAAAERIRLALAEWIVEREPELRVTASFGVTGGDPTEVTLDQLLERADTALYQAKSRGRNRTVSFAQLT